MSLLEEMKKNNTVLNTKGSLYYKESYNNNLDLFSSVSRYNDEDEIIRIFENAYIENKDLSLANLLYILDIRNGKGERRIFKIIFRNLCINHPNSALKILPHISSLGRYDYILEGIDTPIEKQVIILIKEQLEKDKNSDTPSLLAKWLPSHRTHNRNKENAKNLIKKLNLSQKEYRKILSQLRSKLNIIEKNLTKKNYDNINFDEVPAKAMMKYAKAYQKNILEKYSLYKEQVKKGNTKINTTGLFAYEIIKKFINNTNYDDELYDLMWNNQKDVLKGTNTNVLVMADTSGSMLLYNAIPYATSIGLALYTAERNNGIFKNHFITFSSEPYLCEVKGKNIKEKYQNIPSIVENTDIDKAFKLILDTASKNNIKQEELPSHLLIISDMEFDMGVYSKNRTNFAGWKKAFAKKGYKLPIIIFWNVSGNTYGIPVTKFDQDVAMISGFSTNILENILTLEKYNPMDVMLEKLQSYLSLLRG